jgi:hypothetical protein
MAIITRQMSTCRQQIVEVYDISNPGICVAFYLTLLFTYPETWLQGLPETSTCSRQG